MPTTLWMIDETTKNKKNGTSFTVSTPWAALLQQHPASFTPMGGAPFTPSWMMKSREYRTSNHARASI
jgi:hypothetical protein